MSTGSIHSFPSLSRRDALRGLAACSFILAGPRIKVVHAEEISNLQEETKKYGGAAMPGGIKDSPPYMHDGRCLTLEDAVEFFNLVLELKLSKEEKADLVAFMRQL